MTVTKKVKYRLEVTNVPDGVYDECYLCTESNGDGNAERAKRVVSSKRLALRIRAEFRRAVRRDPDSFEPGQDIIIHDVEEPNAL